MIKLSVVWSLAWYASATCDPEKVISDIQAACPFDEVVAWAQSPEGEKIGSIAESEGTAAAQTFLKEQNAKNDGVIEKFCGPGKCQDTFQVIASCEEKGEAVNAKELRIFRICRLWHNDLARPSINTTDAPASGSSSPAPSTTPSDTVDDAPASGAPSSALKVSLWIGAFFLGLSQH